MVRDLGTNTSSSHEPGTRIRELILEGFAYGSKLVSHEVQGPYLSGGKTGSRAILFSQQETNDRKLNSSKRRIVVDLVENMSGCPVVENSDEENH